MDCLPESKNQENQKTPDGGIILLFLQSPRYRGLCCLSICYGAFMRFIGGVYWSHD